MWFLKTLATSRSHATAAKSGLYAGLSGREEKSQKWIHAQGPGRFVVLAALNFAVTQVVAFLPSAMDQRVAKPSHIVNFVRAFLRPGVEPHTWPRFDACARNVTHNPSLIPPH